MIMTAGGTAQSYEVLFAYVAPLLTRNKAKSIFWQSQSSYQVDSKVSITSHSVITPLSNSQTNKRARDAIIRKSPLYLCVVCTPVSLMRLSCTPVTLTHARQRQGVAILCLNKPHRFSFLHTSRSRQMMFAFLNFKLVHICTYVADI